MFFPESHRSIHNVKLMSLPGGFYSFCIVSAQGRNPTGNALFATSNGSGNQVTVNKLGSSARQEVGVFQLVCLGYLVDLVMQIFSGMLCLYLENKTSIGLKA